MNHKQYIQAVLLGRVLTRAISMRVLNRSPGMLYIILGGLGLWSSIKR